MLQKRRFIDSSQFLMGDPCHIRKHSYKLIPMPSTCGHSLSPHLFPPHMKSCLILKGRALMLWFDSTGSHSLNSLAPTFPLNGMGERTEKKSKICGLRQFTRTEKKGEKTLISQVIDNTTAHHPLMDTALLLSSSPWPAFPIVHILIDIRGHIVWNIPLAS